MNTQIASIAFHGQQLVTAKIGEQVFVAMKPIVENIGLQWEAQYKRINRHPVLKSSMSMMDIQMPGDDQRRQVTMLPLKMLNGWLFGVEANRVKPECRDLVIKYQEECFDALYSYWNEGIAINPRLEITPEQQSDLFTMVANINPDGRQRGAIWARFNRHFKIAKYSQLPQAKFEDAKNYLAEVYCNGEYIEREEVPIDFKGLLTNGMVDPSIPYPPEVEAAIERKAYTLSHECFSHIRQHLRKRVAYSCETGDPRYLNTERAMQIIEQGDIGHALAYPYHIQVRSVAKIMQSVAMMANDYSASISKAIN